MLQRHLFLSIPLALTLWLMPHTSFAQTPQVVGVEERERGIQLYRAKDYTESAKILKIAVKRTVLTIKLGITLASRSRSSQRS
jgi:hypothetical protein